MSRIRIVQYKCEGNYFIEVTDNKGHLTLLDTGTINTQEAVKIANEIKKEFPEAKERPTITN